MKKPLIIVMTLVILTPLLFGCISQSMKSGMSSNLVSYFYPEGEMVCHENVQTPVLNLPLRVAIASQSMTVNLVTEVVAFKSSATQGEAVKVNYRKNHIAGDGGSVGWFGAIGLFLLLRFCKIRK